MIEALNCGMFAVVTDTGFARDIIVENISGRILPRHAILEDVRSAIVDAKLSEAQSIQSVSELTWDRLAKFYLADAVFEK
jgi:glycosyltransferase involved in cell wall biosynthesis